MTSSSDLSQPLYGAGVVQAQRRFWRKYLVRAGRASRSEFWWWMAGFVAVSVVLSLINRVLVAPLPASPTPAAVWAYSIKTGVLSTAWSLINFVGAISLTVRRLHDTDRSGWWWFVQLVPGLGSVVLIVLVALPGRPGGRRFDPAAAAAEAPEAAG